MAVNGPDRAPAEVAERIERVRAQIREACLSAGRAPEHVRLVAASKGQPAQAIRAAYAAGQRDFGENFAQELQNKASALTDLIDLRWHFIGRFQSNKAKLLVRTGAFVQTVSAASHLEALAKRHLRRPVQCLLQVSFDDDPNRAGASPDALPDLVGAASRLQGVELRGLMLVPPQEDDARATSRHFAHLRQLAEKLSLPELSMGMSGDFDLAIAEGATMVRVGTALFGARPSP